jgi:hypothetical protein
MPSRDSELLVNIAHFIKSERPSCPLNWTAPGTNDLRQRMATIREQPRKNAAKGTPALLRAR